MTTTDYTPDSNLTDLRPSVRRYVTLLHATGSAPKGAHSATLLASLGLTELTRRNQITITGEDRLALTDALKPGQLADDVEATDCYKAVHELLAAREGWGVKRVTCRRVELERYLWTVAGWQVVATAWVTVDGETVITECRPYAPSWAR